jgi:hypothetical protein
MLRTQTVEKRTLDLIKRLMSDPTFHDFNLVGGTALALKIGHRLSVDIDLFSTNPFDASAIAAYLQATHAAKDISTIRNGVFCFIDKIKIDLIAHQYRLVNDIDIDDGIRSVSLGDIAAMKLNAIYNNGSRLKDFVDMYSLLKLFTLNQILLTCHQKYPDLDMDIVKRSLTYFEDIDFTNPVKFIGQEIPWMVIAERLKAATLRPNELASELATDKRSKGRRL